MAFRICRCASPSTAPGLVGADGATHAGSFDLAYLGCLPDFVIMSPADEVELKNMVATAAAIDDLPSAIPLSARRGGRHGNACGGAARDRQGRIVREGTTVAILSSAPASAKPEGGRQARRERPVATVADARFAKPLDRDLIAQLARHHEVLITVEEGAGGGFGSHVLEFLARDGLLDNGLKVRPLVLPDVFMEHGKPEAMYESAGLNAGGIVNAVIAALGASAATKRDGRA